MRKQASPGSQRGRPCLRRAPLSHPSARSRLSHFGVWTECARQRGGAAGLPGRSRLRPPPVAFPPLAVAAVLRPSPTPGDPAQSGERPEPKVSVMRAGGGTGRGPGPGWGRGRAGIAALCLPRSPFAGLGAALPPGRCWHPSGRVGEGSGVGEDTRVPSVWSLSLPPVREAGHLVPEGRGVGAWILFLKGS
jgi:hypothetical protein